MELWRTRPHPYDEPSPDKGGLFGLGRHSIPLDFTADTVLGARTGQIAWLHFNESSLWPIVLREQHLESLASKYPDPLLNRAFGAALSGPMLVSDGEQGSRDTSLTRTPSHGVPRSRAKPALLGFPEIHPGTNALVTRSPTLNRATCRPTCSTVP